MFRTGLRVIATTAMRLAKTMKIFRKVEIVQPDENAIEQDINKLGIVESFSSSHNKGIYISNTPKIFDRLADDYPGIDHVTRARMIGFILLNEPDYTVMEVKYNAGQDVVYLMVVTEKKNEKYNISYVGCRFHLIPTEILTKSASEFMMHKLFTNIEEARLNPDQLKELVGLEHFIRYLATREFEDPDKLVKAITAQDNCAE